MFHFSHFELYFALHSRVLSTFQQHLLQFPTIICTHIFTYFFGYILYDNILVIGKVRYLQRGLFVAIKSAKFGNIFICLR